jgi:hypothetical protein
VTTCFVFIYRGCEYFYSFPFNIFSFWLWPKDKTV